MPAGRDRRFVCELMRGQSAHRHLALGPEIEGQHVVVGSDASAGWRVQGDRVQPLHVAFTWHSGGLWVADYARLGDVVLGGKQVVDWQRVDEAARLEFGGVIVHLRAASDAEAMQNVLATSGTVTVDPSLGDGGQIASLPTMVTTDPAVALARVGLPGEGLSEPTVPEGEGGKLPAASAIGSAPRPARKASATSPVRLAIIGIAFLVLLLVVVVQQMAGGSGDGPTSQVRPVGTGAPVPQPGGALPVELQGDELIIVEEPPSSAATVELERRAASLVIAGRWGDALGAYRELAQREPQRRSFAEVILVLQDKLQTDCRNGIGPNGEPCGAP